MRNTGWEGVQGIMSFKKIKEIKVTRTTYEVRFGVGYLPGSVLNDVEMVPKDTKLVSITHPSRDGQVEDLSTVILTFEREVIHIPNGTGVER